MTHRILTRTAQVSANAPNASTAYNFTGAAVSVLAFSFVSRTLATGATLAYYADNGTGQYERGLGTWNQSTLTLTRTTIRESSTGSAIVWTSAPTVWSDGRQEEDLLAIGTTATTACAGNDARLSDARTPASHAHNSHTSLQGGGYGNYFHLSENPYTGIEGLNNPDGTNNYVVGSGLVTGVGVDSNTMIGAANYIADSSANIINGVYNSIFSYGPTVYENQIFGSSNSIAGTTYVSGNNGIWGNFNYLMDTDIVAVEAASIYGFGFQNDSSIPVKEVDSGFMYFGFGSAVYGYSSFLRLDTTSGFAALCLLGNIPAGIDGTDVIPVATNAVDVITTANAIRAVLINMGAAI